MDFYGPYQPFSIIWISRSSKTYSYHSKFLPPDTCHVIQELKMKPCHTFNPIDAGAALSTGSLYKIIRKQPQAQGKGNMGEWALPRGTPRNEW